MYLVNESNPAAISLAKKMSEHKHKQDGILNCTPEEIACITNGDFTSFNLTHEGCNILADVIDIKGDK